MKQRFVFSVGWAILASLLLGCRAPEASLPEPVPSGNYIALLDNNSTATSILTGQKLVPATGDAGPVQGALNRSENRLTIDGNAGDISNNRTLTTLDAGGTILLEVGNTSYVGRFAVQPLLSDPIFGVIGTATLPQDMPQGGGAVFIGDSVMQIIDAGNVLDLFGSSRLSADFNAGTIDLNITNLNGTSSDGVSPPISVFNVVDINATDISILGNTFSGGTIQLSNSSLSRPLSGTEQTYLSGNFFGPSGLEAGGVLQILDSDAPNALTIQGSFVGSQ